MRALACGELPYCSQTREMPTLVNESEQSYSGTPPTINIFKIKSILLGKSISTDLITSEVKVTDM